MKKIGITVGLVLLTLPASVLATEPLRTHLCYDGFAGRVYECASKPQFDVTRCYALVDTNKGWEEASCDDQVFHQGSSVVVGIAPNEPTSDEPMCTDDCDLVGRYINPAISALTILVGLVVVIALVASGIRLSAARGDPAALAKARSNFSNAVVGFISYCLLAAFLMWMVPGGLL